MSTITISSDQKPILINLDPPDEYEYGHEVTKRTCLWLSGLPKLRPTNLVSKGKKNFRKHRSTFFSGIADAMADQWGSESEVPA